MLFFGWCYKVIRLLFQINIYARGTYRYVKGGGRISHILSILYPPAIIVKVFSLWLIVLKW